MLSILTIAKQSPPILVALGSTTDKTIEAAIEASTAFPPILSIFNASSVAKGCEVAAIAFEERASLSFVD